MKLEIIKKKVTKKNKNDETGEKTEKKKDKK